MNTLAVVNDAKDSAQEPYSQNSTYSENQKQSGLKPGLASTRYPLEASTASYFESRIRHNFSDIRIHNHNKASKSHKIQSDFNTSAQDNENTLHIQHTVKNQVIQRTIQSGIIQPKLKISQPNDPYEIEADRVAEQIMSISVSDEEKTKIQNNSKNNIQRKCSTCKMEKEEDELKISRKLTTNINNNLEASDGISNQIISTSGGKSLDGATKEFMESRFNYDFSDVRIHDDSRVSELSRLVNARAFTLGNNIFLGQNGSVSDKKLLAHELTHVVQQNGVIYKTANNEPQVMRQEESNQDIIEIEIFSDLDEFQPLGTSQRYRVGDAAATRILMNIQERNRQVVFQVFNFETGQAQEMTHSMWSFYRGAAIIGGSNSGITRLGQQLTPAQWRSLWPNPMPSILRMFESRQLNLDDEALLSGYRGMIRSDAARSLSENERNIDELLNAPDRISRIQEYATGLREASLIRDTLVQRKDELSRRLVVQHSFRFGPPITGTGPNMAQRIKIHQESAQVEQALSFWLSAFPLLTRFQTNQINPSAIETQLRTIKANIISTREQLTRNRLDPMTLDTVRMRLTGRLGPRARGVIEAEDRSLSRIAIAVAVAATVASIAILFLPGGLFIDMAIGIAIAGNAISDAAILGRAANTGLHVDDGLVSQAQAQEAQFTAVLLTVFAVLGAAAAGFRVLRIGRTLHGLNRSMPSLTLAERGAMARAIANDRSLFSTFTSLAVDDVAISARVSTAIRQAGGNIRMLREALGDIGRIAAIPRRVPVGSDIYEPLRRIVDGSDLERISQQTGLTRAQVNAAKQNLMFDEHILLDTTTGGLFRGRFTDTFPEIADIWGRTARGETLSSSNQSYLRRLIMHEFTESAILRSNVQTLEHAFLHGGLDGPLRTALQSQGVEQSMIDNILTMESRPITPYRFAHLVAHFSGGPNP